jgi:hypothetical protein
LIGELKGRAKKFLNLELILKSHLLDFGEDLTEF